MKTEIRFGATRSLIILALACFAVLPTSGGAHTNQRGEDTKFSTRFISGNSSGEEESFYWLRNALNLPIPESLSSELDSEGHWGSSTNGTQISVRTRSPVYLTNGAVPALVIVRNNSTNALEYVHEDARGTGYEFKLARGTNLQTWISPVRRREDLMVGGNWPFVHSLGPCSQVAFVTQLGSMFDVSEAGDYQLTVTRLEQGPGRKEPLRLVSSTTRFRITAHLEPQQLEESQAFSQTLRRLQERFDREIRRPPDQPTPPSHSK